MAITPGVTENRILGKYWRYQAAGIALFVLTMSGLRLAMTGLNEDFGAGFAAGLSIGIVIALVAVGLRRGEPR